MRIVAIGPPGSGKGTQCRRLSSRLGLPHLSTGEMLREIKRDPALGPMIASYIDEGHLVPDECVMKVVVERIGEPACRSGFLLDGCPRTIKQAEMLDLHLSSREQAIDWVLHLDASPEKLVSRLLARAKTEGRADDREEAIAARLEIFAASTAPVLDYYRRRGIVLEIDAGREPEHVYQQIITDLPLPS